MNTFLYKAGRNTVELILEYGSELTHLECVQNLVKQKILECVELADECHRNRTQIEDNFQMPWIAYQHIQSACSLLLIVSAIVFGEYFLGDLEPADSARGPRVDANV